MRLRLTEPVVRPPVGGHMLQRATLDDGLKPYVSAQRGSNKHHVHLLMEASPLRSGYFGALGMPNEHAATRGTLTTVVVTLGDWSTK